jgi:flagellar FliL protein
VSAAFVPIDPIIVSLGAMGPNRHLSFRAQLDVAPDKLAEVTGLMPRIVDVLNSYLRAVDVREFNTPHGLIRLRAQMLRRVQLIVGEGKVNDLLVMEFVLN